jgi:prepilin-type N-terminal cleavage/methylation domain-containing protein
VILNTFLRKHQGRGFTLIELLVVIAIIGLLTSITLISVRSSIEKANLARTKVELRQIATALELYINKNGGSYPPDANRDLPAGLSTFLSGGNWPKAPWPGSVYDWDNWAPADLTDAPQSQVYQISVRFCTSLTPLVCNFPSEPWAQNFDYYSAVYYCLSGPCRAHSSKPLSHPGLCVNC